MMLAGICDILVLGLEFFDFSLQPCRRGEVTAEQDVAAAVSLKPVLNTTSQCIHEAS